MTGVDQTKTDMSSQQSITNRQSKVSKKATLNLSQDQLQQAEIETARQISSELGLDLQKV